MTRTILNFFKLLIIGLGVYWNYLLFSFGPFAISKYPFSSKEKIWKDIYEQHDSLFFSYRNLTDTVLVGSKAYSSPQNSLAFDWEGVSFYGVIKGMILKSTVIYTFWTKENVEKKEV